MKKPRSNPRGRAVWRIGGLTVTVVALVVLVLFKVHGLLQQQPAATSTASQKPKDHPTSKVAFLFLARHQMPLDILWSHFFQGSSANEFSVYIHARPGFVYTKNNTKCRSFIDPQLENSVLVEWGEASMIQAERLLLAEALKDPLNARFILLSDSCVPLYNFRFIYDYVMDSQKSFVDSFVVARDPRYNHKMAPVIWKEGWRKGSQWFVLIRKHAVAVVEDSAIFPVFQKFCKRLALPEFLGEFGQVSKPSSLLCERQGMNTTVFLMSTTYKPCWLVRAADVWIFQSKDQVVAPGFPIQMRGLEPEIERRGVTYSQWKNSRQGTMDRRGWHPVTIDYARATLKAIRDIQVLKEPPQSLTKNDIYKIHYETESRTEWCGIDRGEARPCYLFARKFSRGAGVRLLKQSAAYENRIDLTDHSYHMLKLESQAEPSL